MERKNAWLSYNEADETALEKLAKDYRAFLDAMARRNVNV